MRIVITFRLDAREAGIWLAEGMGSAVPYRCVRSVHDAHKMIWESRGKADADWAKGQWLANEVARFEWPLLPGVVAEMASYVER